MPPLAQPDETYYKQPFDTTWRKHSYPYHVATAIGDPDDPMV
jgi:hypothetical protein